jgi:hypothetical protein
MINSLKKTFLLIPAYIALLLFSCVISVLVYMLYFNTTGLIAGKTLQLFDTHVLINGFFFTTPVVLVLSGTLLSCYRIRHSHGGCFPVIMYVLLGMATWCVLYPAFIELKGHWQNQAATETVVLTPGYFRHSGGDIVYLPYGYNSDDTKAVVISEDASPEFAVSIQKTNIAEMVNKTAPFKDSLIRETIPVIPGWIMGVFTGIQKRAESAWHAGYTSWLCFMSLGLVLFSAYALTFCSEWRFINFLYLCTMEAVTIAFNSLYFTPVFAQFREFSVQLGRNIKFFTYLDEPLLVCVNVFISFVFIALGITAVVKHTKKIRRSGV